MFCSWSVLRMECRFWFTRKWKIWTVNSYEVVKGNKNVSQLHFKITNVPRSQRLLFNEEQSLRRVNRCSKNWCVFVVIELSSISVIENFCNCELIVIASIPFNHSFGSRISTRISLLINVLLNSTLGRTESSTAVYRFQKKTEKRETTYTQRQTISF